MKDLQMIVMSVLVQTTPTDVTPTALRNLQNFDAKSSGSPEYRINCDNYAEEQCRLSDCITRVSQRFGLIIMLLSFMGE